MQMTKKKNNPWAPHEEIQPRHRQPSSWRGRLTERDPSIVTMPKTITTIILVAMVIGVAIFLLTMPVGQ